jgi:beta-galactosidase
VPYAPGVLRAVGRRRDGTAACAAEVRTAGRPAAVRLVADQDIATAAAGDVLHVAFELVDSVGAVVPTADDLVQFTVTGGTILALDNADLRDLDRHRVDQRRAFKGRGLAILRAPQPGLLTLTATASGLRTAGIRIPVAPGVAPATIPPAR